MNPTSTTLAIESNADTPRKNLALFGILMAATVVATAAMSPALLFLLDPARPALFSEGPISPVPFVIAFAVGNTILSAFAIGFGLRLEPSVRMGVPLLRSWLATGRNATHDVSTILLRCSVHAVGLAAIILASGFVFRSKLPELPDGYVFPPIWQGVLMLLGAAIREEVLFRFFALNLAVWIAMKVFRKHEPTAAIVWTTNVLIALFFALMHLLPAAQILTLSGVAIGVISVLVTVAGVLFGWAYWRHGLLVLQRPIKKLLRKSKKWL